MAKQTLRAKIADSISTDKLVAKKDGSFVAMRSYFYTGGVTSSRYAEKVMNELKKAGFDATMVEHDDHYADFRGGAPIEKSSHWWVRFRINAAPTETKPAPATASVG